MGSTRGRYGALLWSVVVALFALSPLVIIVISSFSSVAYGTWPPPGWSLRWYSNLAEQSGLGDAVVLSLLVAVPATLLSMVIGLSAAVGLVRHTFVGRRLVEGLSFAPVLVPKVALGFALFIYLNRLGLFNVGPIGLIAAHIVITLPFVTTFLSAALVRADREVEAAAVDLGATPLVAFLRVGIPQIRDALIATALFVFIISFDEVDTSVFLIPLNEQTLPTWMFQYMQKYQDPTLAALSTVLIAISLLVAASVAALLNRSGVLATLLSPSQRN
jgi:putative spermidine/putrescine transport system permease protein